MLREGTPEHGPLLARAPRVPPARRGSATPAQEAAAPGNPKEGLQKTATKGGRRDHEEDGTPVPEACGGARCPGVSPSCSVRFTYQPLGPSLCPWKPQLTPLAVTASPGRDGARSPRATAPPRATRTVPGAAPDSPQPAQLETQPEVQIRHSLNLVWPPKLASLEQPAWMDNRLLSPAQGSPEQGPAPPEPRGSVRRTGTAGPAIHR